MKEDDEWSNLEILANPLERPEIFNTPHKSNPKSNAINTAAGLEILEYVTSLQQYNLCAVRTCVGPVVVPSGTNLSVDKKNTFSTECFRFSCEALSKV